jgi:hypothetical protein
MDENCVIFEGLSKPNNSWLGRWFLIKAFDKDIDCDVAKIQSILSDGRQRQRQQNHTNGKNDA